MKHNVNCIVFMIKHVDIHLILHCIGTSKGLDAIGPIWLFNLKLIRIPALLVKPRLIMSKPLQQNILLIGETHIYNIYAMVLYQLISVRLRELLKRLNDLSFTRMCYIE
ncbi:hypothetical protein BVC80_951g3 [Macleaya cordata]|uniref:Uncharacterized protein n=1 Tax=Macleaya cordata TaxID=56857 RepID=A0A200R0L5_MACCD|nr:hypothetical protein BVC80_951g3 [Macleaya cordata]